MSRAFRPARLIGALLIAAGLAGDTQAAQRGEEWLPVRDVSLTIAPGSALDFSFLADGAAAGSKGRVRSDLSERLTFETSPANSAPIRFFCASLAWSPASGSYPDHASADRYAEQLKMHGYNLARLHFVDANLMSGRDRDFDFDPVQLDNFRYLLAALKRNGIYWMIDAASSENGAYGGVYPDRWTAKHDLKLQVHFSEDARKHWLKIVSAILGTANPYTGLSPLDDPALAFVTLFNENGLEFVSYLEEARTRRAYPDALREPFNKWLGEVYRTTPALAKAWGGTLGKGESIEFRTVDLPARHGERGPRMRDLQRFFLARERDTERWMTAALRALGYKGLTTAYNNMTTSAAHMSRFQALVSLDSYHDEVLSLAPGTSIRQTSSLDDDAGYVQRMMGARWLNTPFVVSEYDHLFWNSFRREAGLVVPAYAALHGWSGICRHGMGPIDLAYGSALPHKQKMLPYGLGLDPIARAGETVAALLYRRGDVAQSRQRLPIEARLLGDGQDEIPRDLTRLGLVTGIGLSLMLDDAGQPVRTPADSGWPRWLDRLAGKLSGANERSFAERLDRLVASAAITPETAENARRRVYRSDTGEIAMDAPRREFSVLTARTEALTFERLEAARTLGRLTVAAASGPAMIAVSALDAQPVASSRKLLLVLATDALNTGMKFADASRRTVTDYGTLPVRIRRAAVRLGLALDVLEPGQPERLKLTALHLDGTPGAALAVNRTAETISLTLDNGAPSHGPTTFFLLER
jgi:hypothetical protein